jgi:hypothetical protein
MLDAKTAESCQPKGRTERIYDGERNCSKVPISREIRKKVPRH